MAEPLADALARHWPVEMILRPKPQIRQYSCADVKCMVAHQNGYSGREEFIDHVLERVEVRTIEELEELPNGTVLQDAKVLTYVMVKNSRFEGDDTPWAEGPVLHTNEALALPLLRLT